MNNDNFRKTLAIIEDFRKQVLPIIQVAQELQTKMEPIGKHFEKLVETSRIIGQTTERLALSIADSIRPLQESLGSLHAMIAENASVLSSIPHMPFYRDILENIDPESMEYIHSTMEQQADIPFDYEELNIVHPYFYGAAIKINIYATLTNDAIENSSDATQEDKKAWGKIIAILLFLQEVFMNWAFGDTPIMQMQIVQQFEKIVQVVEEYEYPIETTDIFIKTNDDN